MLAAWVLFPLALAVVGAGWGLLVRRLSGRDVAGSLVLPLGLAAALTVAGLFTAWSATARLAVPVVAAVAMAGLLVERRGLRVSRWPLLAALGVLFAYAAPVVLSGQATFAGYIRLDDTATFLGAVDRLMTHGRSVAGLAPSTYGLNFQTIIIGGGYPVGSFMLLGVGRALVGADAAWAFQPYLAVCAAALALVLYALLEPLVRSARIRALAAALAAQPALLYGYSLWGGIKELTAAFLLALMAALATPLLRGGHRLARPRELLPLAFAAAALAQTLGPGAVVWIAPLVAVVLAVWLLRARRERNPAALAISTVWLGGLIALLSIPMLVVASTFVAGAQGSLFSTPSGGGSSAPGGVSQTLGNLIHPLSVFQVAGVWPVGDFRLAPSQMPTALLIWLVGVGAAAAVWWGFRNRSWGLSVYLGVALAGCAVTGAAGATPWVLAKEYAITSPAVLGAAVGGAAALAGRRRAGLVAAVLLIGGGALWSNVLAYHDVLLAPRPRLAELQQIGSLVAGRGPTLLNEYELYGDRHFLRAGDPQAPAEYRPSLIPTRDGALLTKSAWADLDSFSPSTLLAFRSIVVRRSPTQSRPPSVYRLRWQGSYYELWQRPATASVRIVVHTPYGDSESLPYCGQTTTGAFRALCSVQPVGVPSCPEVRALARIASSAGGQLVAYQRPAPIVVRATEAQQPSGWPRVAGSDSLLAETPGTLVTRIAVATGERYGLWLGGSFARGFDVKVDGRSLGRVSDQLSTIGQYVHVADLTLRPGVHSVALTYPQSGLAPGSGDNVMTSLDAIALDPLDRRSRALLTVAPRGAATLCGRQLDWLEVVAPGG